MQILELEEFDYQITSAKTTGILTCYKDFKAVVLKNMEFQLGATNLFIDDMIQDWYIGYKESSTEHYKVPFTEKTIVEFLKNIFPNLRDDFSKHPIRFRKKNENTFNPIHSNS